jgi:bifunctional UDP-N-acetylglucosamine pyrophosphorylase/glucosamine-1-phosphate N-acetyltransferase
MESNLAAIVLAAGMGTRMRSARAKVLHELAGEPMIAHALRALSALGPRPLIVVIGNQAAEVEAASRAACPGNHLSFATQEHQRGTGDAARCALTRLPADYHGPVLVTYGDMPALRASTLAAFLDEHRRRRAPLSLISVRLDDPGAYGRVIRGKDGEVEAIVEARDATPEQLAITEINMGLYLADADLLRSALPGLEPKNVQREYYLTDLVAIARRRGLRVEAVVSEQVKEFRGINSREELAQMEAEIRAEVNRKLMASGVTIIDPATAYIGPQVEIGRDTIIGPNVQITGRSRVGWGVRIEGTAFLVDVTIGDGCHIKIGVRAEKCAIGPDCEIGPFANLREGTELEGHNRIGNFVETKKAKFGRGTKASHLSYLGDAIIGRETNVGCGVITVNYDGYDKHVTQIGDRCMIGCDTQLVAPVKVGNDVYVASGTTIVREVEDGALVMSHHPQREKPAWMAVFHKRHGGRAPWWEKE